MKFFKPEDFEFLVPLNNHRFLSFVQAAVLANAKLEREGKVVRC